VRLSVTWLVRAYMPKQTRNCKPYFSPFLTLRQKSYDPLDKTKKKPASSRPTP